VSSKEKVESIISNFQEINKTLTPRQVRLVLDHHNISTDVVGNFLGSLELDQMFTGGELL